MLKVLILVIFVLGSQITMAEQKRCQPGVTDPSQGWNPPNSAVTPELRKFYDLGEELEAAVKEENLKLAHSIATQS
jgi:hypothetical protein